MFDKIIFAGCHDCIKSEIKDQSKIQEVFNFMCDYGVTFTLCKKHEIKMKTKPKSKG